MMSRMPSRLHAYAARGLHKIWADCMNQSLEARAVLSCNGTAAPLRAQGVMSPCGTRCDTDGRGWQLTAEIAVSEFDFTCCPCDAATDVYAVSGLAKQRAIYGYIARHAKKKQSIAAQQNSKLSEPPSPSSITLTFAVPPLPAMLT
jgi:hypothetical protein